MHRYLLPTVITRALTTSVLAVFAVGLAPCSSALPDLTATVEEYVGSGIVYKRLLFKGERERGEMELPNGWSHRNVDPSHLQLLPGSRPFAEALIRTEPLPATATMEDAAMQTLQQQALNAVPPASQDVSVVRAGRGEDAPGERASFEVVVSYKVLGHTFHRSTLFVNAADHRLVVQLTAIETDFDELSASFQRAFQSLHWHTV